MLRTKRLDDAAVANLKAKPKRQTIPDPELRGHYIRITPNGSKSFWAVARDPKGKQIWKLIGSPPMPIADAREKAMAIIRSIRMTVMEAATDGVSFEAVASNWFERHVVKNKLRSELMIRGLLRNHIFPAFKGMSFIEVRRKHVAALLDRVEDDCGARSADYVLSVVSSICNWYALRDDNYETPIIRGMKRQTKTDRDRILNDVEVSALWKANGLFGNFTKLALLTAQRREKLMELRWDDVRNGIWHIRAEDRQKGTGETLPLPPMALDVIEDQRRLNGESPFVFAGPKGTPRSKLSRLDKKFKAAHQWPHWTLHDLRRTARSLMSRAGVLSEHAERVLGHAIGGVEGVYNRHAYLDEKGEALKLLATKVRDIVSRPPDNVEKLTRRAS